MVQLIAVTALAVVISNVAVAWWFERGNEQQNESSLNERVLDRAASVVTTLDAVPAVSRPVVMKNMSSRVWQFTYLPPSDTSQSRPMDEAETRFAQRLEASLPVHARRGPVSVQLHESPNNIPAGLLPDKADKDSVEAFRLIIPLDR